MCVIPIRGKRIYFPALCSRDQESISMEKEGIMMKTILFRSSVGWIPFSLKGLAIGIGIFIPFYMIIWTAFYLYFRFQVKILNEGIDKRRD